MASAASTGGYQVGGRAARVSHPPQQEQRNPQAERGRHTDQQPADLPPLGGLAPPVAQREQDDTGHDPERIRAICRREGPAQRHQGGHRHAAAHDRHPLAGHPGQRDVGAADRVQQRQEHGDHGCRPDDRTFVAALRAPGREQADHADAGDHTGGAGPLA
jgi:hypothetical protein